MTKLGSMALVSLTFAGLAGCYGAGDAADTSASEQAVRDDRAGHVIQVLTQTNLVADEPGVALRTEPNLVNAWGLAFNTINGAAWVSSNEKGLALVFNNAAATVLTVTLPPVGSNAPTGQVFNTDLTAFGADRFIIVSEDGTIVGWQPGQGAQVRVPCTGACSAVYKGVAIAHVGGHPRLYAADFHNGRIDVFGPDYQPITDHDAFVDPRLPAHYAPFNIFVRDDLLYVAYARQELPDARDDDPGQGHGVLDLYDARGHLLHRLVSHGPLNSPWGMAFAPDAFGAVSGQLLVGNFGDGRINAFRIDGCALRGRCERGHDDDDDEHGERVHFLGAIGSDRHHPLVIDGLWALVFPPDAGGFSSHDLYFTAGPGGEDHGLYGRLELP